jgi:uncharacterized membrane protein
MSTSTTTDRNALARGLGVLSLAVGVPQIASPAGVARAIGTTPRPDVQEAITSVGVRELTTAAGLLTRIGSTPTWLWARVAGDVMDLALLGRALRDRSGRHRGRGRTVAATAAVAGVTALDLMAARRAGRGRRDLELTAAVTIARSAQDVYDYWRGLERLPTFMYHLQSVEWVGEGRTRWTANAPVKKSVSWEAELVEDRRGEVIAWRSLPGADVENSGSIRFKPAPGDRGTEVRVHLRYAVPGGRAGQLVARLLGEEPHQQVEDDLRRFKQIMETGEVLRSEGSLAGHSARDQLLQHPGQPPQSS